MRRVLRLYVAGREAGFMEGCTKNPAKRLQRDETVGPAHDDRLVPRSAAETVYTIKGDLELRHHDGCRCLDRLGHHPLR